MFGLFDKQKLPDADKALPGRERTMSVGDRHRVTGQPMEGPFREPLQTAMFGMGCFWGVERLFWRQKGVYTTAAGYAGGLTPNPTYEEVCSGRTGHNEVVRVVFDPGVIDYAELLKLFWENHDPTQGMRQGPDRGTQYRSGIYTYTPAQQALAEASRDAYQAELTARGLGRITTEVLSAPPFYFAEDYHQQYLDRHPNGYCSMRGTGAVCALPEASGRHALVENA